MQADPLYWRLVYPDGKEVTEPPYNASIREARRGAKELHVVRMNGTALTRIELDGWLPIFYRKRSAMLTRQPDGTVVPGAHLDATVFGRARDLDDRIDGTLWAVVGGKIIDCPAHLVDRLMVEVQLGVFPV